VSSVAQRKRHKRAANKLKPAEPRKAATTAQVSAENIVPIRNKTGLDWLAQKGRITARQKSAGRKYGEDYRICQVAGMEPLRSCLNDQPGSGTGGIGLSMASYELEAKERFALAQGALSYHPDMVGACDLICGRDFTPWEVIAHFGGGQRDAERITNTLKIALDLLAKHYG